MNNGIPMYHIFYKIYCDYGHLVEGDANGRFFHACIRNNSRKTQLFKLMVNDQWIEDDYGIKTVVKEHFEGLYREEVSLRPRLDGVPFKQVSLEDNLFLTAPFTRMYRLL